LSLSGEEDQEQYPAAGPVLDINRFLDPPPPRVAPVSLDRRFLPRPSLSSSHPEISMADLFVAVLDDNRDRPYQWQVSAEAATEQELRNYPYHDGTVWQRRRNDSDGDRGAITLYLASTNEPSTGRVYRVTRGELPKMHALLQPED
jgi:hypothetical protein